MSKQVTASLLVVAGCLAAGCTAIVYGDFEPSRTDDAPGGGLDMSNEQPSPPGPSAGEGGRAPVPGAEAGGADANHGGVSGESNGGVPHADAGGAVGSAGEATHEGGAAGKAAEGDGGSGFAGEASAGGSPQGGQGGAAEGPDDGRAGAPPLTPGDPARGYKLVVLNNCYRCHGGDLAGQGFYRNITPDEATGIGGWSDAEIARGIAGGMNKAGELLCASMPIYSGVSAQGMRDLISFLRSVPARHNPVTAVCPGHDP